MKDDGDLIRSYHILFDAIAFKWSIAGETTGDTTMTMSPKEAFRAAYMLELAKQHAANPDKYVWAASELPVIVDKMITALERRSANIDSPAIKAACKTVKLKPSIARIAALLARATWADAMAQELVS